MKTRTDNINALYDLQPGESLELNVDPMGELGERKDVIAYPNYQISSAGAFINKRILKHFCHQEGNGPAVTLYHGGRGWTCCVLNCFTKFTSVKMLSYHK
jgi:hypothetical protein